jgi:DNA-binding HxlR family transcriptional regulator
MTSDLVADHDRRHNILGAVYDKWTMQVVLTLSAGTRRNSELQRELGEVTPKVLTETLRRLEYDGLVQRTVYAVVPPKVEYSLTALGRTFVDALDGLCEWAVEHQNDVEEARMRFESKSAKESK